jgi:hypothetical protein
MKNIRVEQKQFYDISLSFEPNPRTGDITLLRDDRAIQNSIKNIIQTIPSELPFRSDFGSNVRDYLFEFIDTSTSLLIELEITRAVNYNEPRVELIDVSVSPNPDANQFQMKLKYKIIGYDKVVEINDILTPTS